MEKKYIVIVVVVIALWGAFMGYRHMNKKKSSQANNADTYRRLVEMSKKSPRAGLSQMAKALNRYYQDNKAYPASLTDLYPKYIASSAFISEIEWNYEPGADDFSLSKTVVYKKREMVASIDKDLRPEVDTGRVMVAGRQPAVRRPPRVEEAAPEELDVSEEVTPELEIVDEVEMTSKEATVVVAAAGSMLTRTDSSASSAIDVQREMARIVARVGPEVKTEVDAGEKSGLGINLERYLVWKDKDGFIGIGNVQYPYAEDMYVAVQDRWYIVKRRASDVQVASATGGTPGGPVEGVRDVDTMAAELSSKYLVWKNESGVIGIGNVQYPDRGRLTIASADEWRPLKRASFPQDEKTVVTEKTDARVDMDRLAADLRSQYLVWKDENGVIGVGNVEYPDKERLLIASLDKWDTLKDEPLPQGRETVTEERKDSGVITSGISKKYLMWKDKNGVVGYGNVQYPESISQIHSGQSWEKAVN